MNDPSPSGSGKERLRQGFSALAATYDQLHFLKVAARRLADLADLRAGARVLDVATGTGEVALAAAERVGPAGRVVAVDLAPGMVARARERVAAAGLANVELREGDAEHLGFPDSTFDAVLCGASLFFVPDMLAALREWRRVLAPGGSVGFSAFGPTFLQPMRQLWEDRLRRHGATPSALPTHRLADPAVCRSLLTEAGFTGVEVKTEQLGYHLPSPEGRWTDLMAGPEGKPILSLPAAIQEQLRIDHLAELAALTTERGLWVDVTCHFAFGRR